MAENWAPIALFVFDRPEHTQRTLESLQRNIGASQSHLVIFSDGYRDSSPSDQNDRIGQVRDLIRNKPWCRTVDIVESETNMGLARSITQGVSHVLGEHGRVIVLEDDLETSPEFLRYMNAALEMYAEDEKVFQISAFNIDMGFLPPRKKTGFLRVSTSWGWATWGRAWQYYRSDAKMLIEEIDTKGKPAFDLDGYSFHYEELQRNVSGELNTWAVKWYASVFLKQGLCLYPYKSLVRNHGYDGTGENCHADKTGYHRQKSLAVNVNVQRQPVREDNQYLNNMQQHYKHLLRLWTHTRLRDRVLRKAKSALGFIN